ncbi:MAG TPA: phosphoenolpyruvate synthase [Saprospiraceae bacterium]|nr:phosphoenolpyruvate synthase [Saprospiraceae bacterium]
MNYCIPFSELSLESLPKVGGKNASLGEMFRVLTPHGINIPDGFATTAEAYWDFLEKNGIRTTLTDLLKKLDTREFTNLHEIGMAARDLILQAAIPAELQKAILQAYVELQARIGSPMQLAVRSSATAEDLPTASFAGQLESFLNVDGEKALIAACHRCFASLFTDRAIKYREDNGFNHMSVALSIGVQQMVRADTGSSGVAFTIDPETGFRNAIIISCAWGLGENVVQGIVNPDEFVLFKPGIERKKKAILSKRLGSKLKKMVYAKQSSDIPGASTVNMDTPENERERFALTDDEATTLGNWCLMIEKHYKRPMDIEWAKDGFTGELYIVQARPETVHSSKEPYLIHTYTLKSQGKMLAEGIALGSKIAKGKARILRSPAEAHKLQKGEVLITDITNPDWDPIMKKAAAIVTNKGGRTSHAAIVAREIGVVAVVGTGNAMTAIKDGQDVTVSCAEGKNGKIYDGALQWDESAFDARTVKMPDTEVMFILGDPEKAFQTSFLPNNGIGLMRLEFVINTAIRVHPMALVKFDELKDVTAKAEIEKLTAHYPDKKLYFIEQLAFAVSTIAAAFYPKEVIVRMSDFKTNEYANLIGGKQFEPEEENPMLGFRGASRYYSDLYKEGFRLECEAMKVVRNEMGLTNVKLMIPFCRTVEEGEKVVALMAEYGLHRGENNLEIYVMIEIPSNVILAEEFAKVFDGFSIGSNDLTQLTLGLDRDSRLVSELFNEKNPAVKSLIAQVIASARQTGTPIGLCGQAPSDFPEFAQFLVEEGIDSISFNPDALLKGIENIRNAEKRKKNSHGRVSKEEQMTAQA